MRLKSARGRDMFFLMKKLPLSALALFAVLASAGPPAAAERAVSVLYFQNTARNADYDWLSKGIADMLITDLAGTGQVTVVERESLQKVLAEQELALSGIFDEKGAVQIGKLLSAGRIVMGSFIVMQGALRVDAKLVDVESGKVEKAVQSTGDAAKLFEVEKKLARSLLAEMGVKAAGELAAAETGSVDAARAYYTGLNLLDSGDYAKAAAQFKQAAGIDPLYYKPQKSLEEAYRFLKDFKKQRYQREINELYAKAEGIKKRLSAPKFLSYSDFLTDCYAKGLKADEIKKLTDADPSLFMGDTPAQAVWNLQHTLMEIGDLAEEYFEDTETEAAMHAEIMNIAGQARARFKDDPFLPEILYMELFGLQYFERYEDLMKACEYLMTAFPTYRMMWAIEDFYERAMVKLGLKEEEDD